MGKHKIGLTSGTFDLLHAGHVIHLEECKKYCDYLIVGLQTDPSIDRPEKNKPIMSLEERYRLLRANRWVDAVVIYEREDELYKLDNWLPTDIRFMGADHKGRIHHKIKSKIIYTSRNHNYSSSELRERCCIGQKG